ncbi:cadherin-23 [Anopheles ziemanni]|uniref:cadherin-23 n=1 Tax=Anopheles coustani TaxID=139045 RepID=UPI00265AC7B9|nr:cadherin-23 [Anopheles coustani]XP_058169064.1 cadherin-23 [Anopheles ziemanni]
MCKNHSSNPSKNEIFSRTTNRLKWDLWVLLILCWCVGLATANRAPVFLIDDHAEIVIRLKEFPETPVGTLIYRLRGYDADGDPLTFGVQKSADSHIIRLTQNKSTEAYVFLNHELDREARDEYTLILTLTDGRLGEGNFVTQSFLLLVEDINDNEPIFRPFASVLEVPEDSPPGILTTLEAVDRDEGAYGQVVYYIQGPREEDNVFSVATVNGKGVVRLARGLDYERQHFYHINVLAVDRAIQGRINTGTAALLVRVKDVEDQPPEFLVTQPVVRIAEDAPVGSEVLRVKAVDGDRGINNRIRYGIANNASELFEIDRYKGSLRTRQKLDREDPGNPINGAFILEVVATEESKLKPPPSATMEITVIVTDVNDEVPRFRSESYECEIGENAQENTLATFLEGSMNEVFDYDQGKNGTFRLSLQPPSDIFEVIPKKAINEATFGIRVRKSALLDYERLRQVNLTLVASEVEMGGRSSTAQLRILIRDQNDNFPEFSRPVYEVNVPENVTTGTVLVRVEATDIDSGEFGTEGIRYTNLTGGIASSLKLDSQTGTITFASTREDPPTFDREIVPVHYLSVEARDNGGRGNRNTVQLVLNLLDVNDHAPVFVQKQYEVRLRENAFEFESPIAVEARDLDQEGTPNSAIEYRLLGSVHSEHFLVDRRTGRLSVREAVDFERLEGGQSDTRPIALTVEARDGGEPQMSAQVTVTVFVQDVNDHAPVFLEAQYSLTVPEDTPANLPILRVVAMDSDGSFPNNLVSYRIQQGADGRFVIGSETGEISVASGASLDPNLLSPDEMNDGSNFVLEVIATDGGNGDQQLQGSCLVNVTVTDVNNKPPYFIGPTSVAIRENTPVGTEVYRLLAADPDEGAMLRYYIDRSQSEGKTEEGALVKLDDYDFVAAFVLNETNGLLKIAKLLDREKISDIKLACVVEDVAAERGDQMATTVLRVTILDENDNNPKFRKPFYKHSIAENSQFGVPVCTVVAEDADLNKTIRYNLEGEPAVLELLHVDEQTGELVVRNRIDHEEFGWLNFSVRAVDSGVPPRASFVEVFVQVLDENDNNPYFVDGISDFYVAENASIGTEIAVILAKDLDSGDFGRITYILDRISSKEKFNIDPEKGVLRVAGPLDREDTDEYMMAVEAWDNYPYGYLNGESRNAFKHILVHVTDVNDNVPVLQKPTGCSMVTEYHNINEPIVKLRATDADDPVDGNGQVSFDINDASGIFYIQQSAAHSAEVYARGPLKNLYGNYTLEVLVSDLGAVPNTVRDTVEICVTDFNDHPPVFVVPNGNATVKVFENITIGKPFFQVHAYDEDVGENAIVRYRLKMDSAGNYRMFAIDKDTGEISVASPLDRELQNVYDLRIEAYDQGVPTPLSSSVDLMVYVRDVNDNQPQFLLKEISLNFTEHTTTGVERIRLPDTVDHDYLDPLEGPSSTVCYYIVQGNEDGHFMLDPFSHDLTVGKELDREMKSRYKLHIKASEDCTNLNTTSHSVPIGNGGNLLKVTIYVNDINDNSPMFESQIFTGGISTSSQFGSTILQLKANDADDGPNGLVRYYRHGEIRKTLAEGLDELRTDPFLVDIETGKVLLNFFPQKSMRGYFDFSVTANDSYGCHDRAHVFIYLIREDQRVKFILRQRPSEIRHNINSFREILSNVSGCIVNIDDIRLHENPDGSVDRTKSDMFMHLVDQKNNSVLEVHQVLQLLDKHVEKLDRLFKEFNVLDTQASELIQTAEMDELSVNIVWLFVTNLILGSLLIVVIGVSVSSRLSYRRRLRAAKIAAYGTSGPSRMYQEVLGAVPNTNKHSLKGSNPIWISDNDGDWPRDEFDKCKDAIDAQYERSLSSGFFIDNCQLQYEGRRGVAAGGNGGPEANNAANYRIKKGNDESTLCVARNLETTEL